MRTPVRTHVRTHVRTRVRTHVPEVETTSSSLARMHNCASAGVSRANCLDTCYRNCANCRCADVRTDVRTRVRTRVEAICVDTFCRNCANCRCTHVRTDVRTRVRTHVLEMENHL